MTSMRPERLRVTGHLIHQICAVTSGRPLWNGKLRHFREAIASKLFPLIVRRVKSVLDEDLFSTLDHIEAMEHAYVRGDRVELVVQCCLIYELCDNPVLVAEAHRSDIPWIFKDCWTCEEIARTRSRLDFIGPESCLRRVLDKGFEDAVRRVLSDHEPGWEELLLIFKGAGAHCLANLLPQLIMRLQGLWTGIPREAATLFLSFVSDAIYYLNMTLGGYACERDGTLILELLDLGASLTVTRENHPVLFQLVTDKYLAVDGDRWWLRKNRSESGVGEPYPTTLYKLLSQKWTPGVIEKLSQHTCCSLEAFGIFRQNCEIGVPDLRCLAARAIRDVDVVSLNDRAKLFTLKHRSLPTAAVDF